MPIKFDSEQKQFHLYTKKFSLVINLFTTRDKNVVPLIRYYGAPLKGLYFYESEMFANGFDTQNTTLPFALPTSGHGDFRPLMLRVRNQDGNDCTLLNFIGYEIISGKPQLEGLPSTYAENDGDCTSLILHLRDIYCGLDAFYCLTVFEEIGALCTSVKYKSYSNHPLTLERYSSVCLDLPSSFDVLHLQGAWARERSVERVPASHLTCKIQSNRGASSHQHNPFVALVSEDANEFTGECYGVNLVYSGSFSIEVDNDSYSRTRLVAGVNEENNFWTLEPGETFQTPEAVCAYSSSGLNEMSNIFHDLYRKHLCRGEYRDKVRPILINNWEATYFNFNEEKLLNIATEGKELGMELFVLDDGWFGKRDNDTSSLGDWYTDMNKLPSGLLSLSNALHDMGMKFGLWFEPEMISPNSDLFRQHSDWVLHAPNHYITTSRTQYILDMSRRDVQDYLIDCISKVLSENKVDYVKWDMNRNFAEIGSLDCSGKTCAIPHRYMLGVYRVMEEVTSAFPNILFEGCSGGGGRFDAGMLYYMPQIWASDNSDAVSRLKIQYGTSMVYPPSSICAHVSAIPNHQTKRQTPLATRGLTAMSGVFGYELDLTNLTPEEKEAIKTQVELNKKLRSIIMHGKLTRLISPFEGDHNLCAWQFTYKEDVLVFAFQILQNANNLSPYMKLKNLEDGLYKDISSEKVFDSQFLENRGLRLPFCRPGQQRDGDFQAALYQFKKIEA